MNKIINIDTDYFVGYTTFGKVILERIEQRNPPITRTIVVDSATKMFAQIRNNTESIKLLYQHLRDKDKDFFYNISSEHMPYPEKAIIKGWQMNGNFFYEDKIGLDTVEKFLKHFLVDALEEFKLLPRFNQLVIIEFIEKYIPEVIINNIEKFELLKFNDRIKQEFKKVKEKHQ